MDYCRDCGSEIPEERVEILNKKEWPLTCVNCSKVAPAVVFMDYAHKTAGEVVVVPNNPDGTHDDEAIRLAERVFRRSR